MLHLNTCIFTILNELKLDILTTIVISEDLEFPPRLVFNQILKDFEEAKKFRLMLVSWNISPPVDSKVFHWYEWFISRTNRGQRLKTLPICCRYLEYKALTVHLCTYKKYQRETNQSNKNMII